MSQIWAYAASYLLEKDTPLNKPANTLSSKLSTRLFTTPPLVVTFGKKPDEAKDARLQELGFSVQSVNKYVFYKGPASEEAVTELIRLGAHADAYSPYGTCNIDGYLCMTIMDKVLNGVLASIAPNNITSHLEATSCDNTSITYNEDHRQSYIKKAEDLTSKALFFPYFDGLVLPDKSTTTRTLLVLISDGR